VPRGVPKITPSPGERGYKGPHELPGRPGRKPMTSTPEGQRKADMIRALEDLGCNTPEISLLSGVLYATAYRYQVGFGEYRHGRINWRVRARMVTIVDAQKTVRRHGAQVSDVTAEIASELLSDVEGLPEDVRDILKYYGR